MRGALLGLERARPEHASVSRSPVRAQVSVIPLKRHSCILASQSCILASQSCILASQFCILSRMSWMFPSRVCILASQFWRLSRMSGIIRDDPWILARIRCILANVRCILADVRGSSRMSVDILEDRFGTLANVQNVQFLITSILARMQNRFARRFSTFESRPETFSRVQTIFARMQN